MMFGHFECNLREKVLNKSNIEIFRGKQESKIHNWKVGSWFKMSKGSNKTKNSLSNCH